MKIQAASLDHALQSGQPIALLDVRTPVEYAERHIAGSQLMPLDQMDPAAVKAAIGHAGQCVLVCQGGHRAEQAFQKLTAAGCDNLAVLEGGVVAWEAAGLPLTRGNKSHLPLMRQVQLSIGLGVLAGAVLALTVDPRFALIPAFFGAGLTFAGSTGWCGLAILLAKMPWNRVARADGNVKSCTI